MKSPPPEIARNHWLSSANFQVHNQSEASNFSNPEGNPEVSILGWNAHSKSVRTGIDHTLAYSLPLIVSGLVGTGAPDANEGKISYPVFDESKRNSYNPPVKSPIKSLDAESSANQGFNVVGLELNEERHVY